jgi:transcriptional regulator with XRE-family HTH domain
MDNLTIAKQIKFIRQGLGITQKELADKVNKLKSKKAKKLNRQKVADYELGRTRIPADDFIKIQSLAS